jgi:hypothetical protein
MSATPLRDRIERMAARNRAEMARRANSAHTFRPYPPQYAHLGSSRCWYCGEWHAAPRLSHAVELLTDVPCRCDEPMA